MTTEDWRFRCASGDAIQGTWIGVHAGQVQQITEDAVIVEEEIENAIGEVALTTRELKLQKPPGE